MSAGAGGARLSAPAGADRGALRAGSLRADLARACIAPAICARWRADGTLEFLGRLDTRSRSAASASSWARSRRRSRRTQTCAMRASWSARTPPASQRLVAYVVGRRGGDRAGRELRAHLAAAPPGAMMPAAFVSLDRLPLTPNGKLDREALPAPAEDAPPRITSRRGRRRKTCWPASGGRCCGSSAWAPPTTSSRLGGHSLTATRVVARIRKVFERDLPLAALFEAPTLGDARRRRHRRRGRRAAGPVPPSAASRATATRREVRC